MSTRHRHASLRLIARIVVAVLLFGQLSVAAHACMFGGRVTMQPCPDHPEPLEAEPFDALCKAHCEADDQTSDQAKLPVVDVVKVILVVRTRDAHAPSAPRERDIEPAAASPPLPILLCSLRN